MFFIGPGSTLAERILLQTETHCNESSIYVFPEKELRGISPNFHIQVSASYLYIYIFSCSRIGKPILGINESLTDTRMWKLGLRPSNSFSGSIFVSNFRYCVFAVHNRVLKDLLCLDLGSMKKHNPACRWYTWIKDKNYPNFCRYLLMEIRKHCWCSWSTM